MEFANSYSLASSVILFAAGLASAQTATVTLRVDSIDGKPGTAVVQVPSLPDGKDSAPPTVPPAQRRTVVMTARSPGQFMGVYASPVPPAMAAQLRIKRGIGLVVEGLVPGSAAERAGIQQYDVISGIDGQPLQNTGQVEKVFSQHKEGEEIPVEIIREGHRQTVSIAVPSRPQPARSKNDWTTPDQSQGYGSFKLTPRDQERFDQASDRIRSEIEKQEKHIEELTAKIRDEAEQAKRQIQDLKDQIRREAQQQKEQLQRELKEQKDKSDDDRADKSDRQEKSEPQVR